MPRAANRKGRRAHAEALLHDATDRLERTADGLASRADLVVIAQNFLTVLRGEVPELRAALGRLEYTDRPAVLLVQLEELIRAYRVRVTARLDAGRGLHEAGWAEGGDD